MKPYLNYFAQFLNSGNPSSWNKTRSCLKNIQVAINSKSVCILWWLVLSHKINVLLERGKMFREQALATQPPEWPLATGSLDWSRSYHSPRHWLAEEKSTYIRSATNAALKEWCTCIAACGPVRPLFRAHQRIAEAPDSAPSQLWPCPSDRTQSNQ